MNQNYNLLFLDISEDKDIEEEKRSTNDIFLKPTINLPQNTKVQRPISDDMGPDIDDGLDM